MANFKTLPGFREFYPEDYAKRKHIFQIWRQVARRFGFQEFDGPVLESLELFKAKSGDEIESQLFCFTDKGGREVSLRPEMTPTLARMVGAKANALKRPIKWFCLGDNFRYEKQQRGRLRCFSQLNVDILGEAGPSADIELISLLIDMLTSFGLTHEDFYIRLSDRNMWFLYLEALGNDEAQVTQILGIVDKWERLPEDAVREKLTGIVGDKGRSLWEAIDAFIKIDSLPALRKIFDGLNVEGESAERLQARLDDWSALLGGLELMGYKEFLQLDLSIVRGLAYYTGFVFEAFDRKGEFRALAGGGRYDTLVKKMGGPDMPAVGFGMGDVVLGELLADRGCMPQFVDTVDVYAVIGGEEERKAALADIGSLRQAGYSVDYAFKNQNFGKQFKAASAAGARLAVIYGSEELEKGVVKIRNMSDRSEEEVPRSHLAEAVRSLL
ncbi:histidine--tRNA ligase [Puniceicoccaceae bacterium K14]|nr:histidine--tRNA ligase [Puniceicoccaceae bacterium K14]